MRNFTVLITPRSDRQTFEALVVDLPLPIVTGRTLAEAQHNVLTAIQRHVDLACEAGAVPAPAGPGRPDEAGIARRIARVRLGQGVKLEIPESLLARD
ncbi:MAG: type II toxin-antitoxin system HicB family antitoxin [Betaproteobacteria bacterium]